MSYVSEIVLLVNADALRFRTWSFINDFAGQTEFSRLK
jgi:hypothetical protein